MRLFKSVYMGLNTVTGSHSKRTNIITHALRLGCNKVSQAQLWLAVRHWLLLAQPVCCLEWLIGLRIKNHYLILSAVGRKQSIDGTCLEPFFVDDLFEHLLRIGKQLLGFDAFDGVVQYIGESPAELPGVEKRHPIDGVQKCCQRVVVKHMNTELGRLAYYLWRKGEFFTSCHRLVKRQHRRCLFVSVRRTLRLVVAFEFKRERLFLLTEQLSSHPDRARRIFDVNRITRINRFNLEAGVRR